MTIVTIHEAKTHLSRLIARVLAGEEVTIARGKEPVVKLMPVKEIPKAKRKLGHLAHLIPPGKDPLEDGFWDPLPEEDLKLWNGEVDDPNDAL
ncbi:prevent-host-death family protein [Sphingopyxis panaciterrae]|uniref:type II toxin-antitoxin system Phd/YefM family antitoxin n=1 Tax=Sphingopyxis panaciterrae TaxID=363841 RepID=UPI0014245B62|nr:type II toxin-antitoxin system prevent-host-death family antitoxin [Sphingopyxis panaciterrae]NIJ38054.1 prevent-host-death family protein [Sphingopyxis panaciterrae]